MRAPLAPGAQNTHDAVDDFADIDRADVPARLGRRDHWSDKGPSPNNRFIRRAVLGGWCGSTRREKQPGGC